MRIAVAPAILLVPLSCMRSNDAQDVDAFSHAVPSPAKMSRRRFTNKMTNHQVQSTDQKRQAKSIETFGEPLGRIVNSPTPYGPAKFVAPAALCIAARSFSRDRVDDILVGALCALPKFRRWFSHPLQPNSANSCCFIPIRLRSRSLAELTGRPDERLIGEIQTQRRMNTYARLELAFKNLLAALDQLEAACERRLKADAERGNLEEELAVLQDDRMRLALELDDAQARSKSLEIANGEVARRLAKASSTIRVILAQASREQ